MIDVGWVILLPLEWVVCDCRQDGIGMGNISVVWFWQCAYYEQPVCYHVMDIRSHDQPMGTQWSILLNKQGRKEKVVRDKFQISRWVELSFQRNRDWEWEDWTKVHFEKDGLLVTDHDLYVEHSSIDLVINLIVTSLFGRARELVQIAGMSIASRFPLPDVQTRFANIQFYSIRIRTERSYPQQLDKCLREEKPSHMKEREEVVFQRIDSTWLEKCDEHDVATRLRKTDDSIGRGSIWCCGTYLMQ